MAIITFWSDGEKETGKTLSMAAIATEMAMENTYKILMFNAEQSDDTLERCFFERRRPKKMEMDLSNRTDLATGISGLTKAVLSNKTSPEIIKNYTKTIFRNRLEMLTEGKLTDEDYQNQRKTFKEIIKTSNKYYNLVLVDLSGNINENTTREILEMSDLIVVCLSQNLKRLDEFLELKRQTNLLNSSKTIILIGKCDENSKYNSKNLLRYTGLRELLPVTYNVQFFEASNEGKLADLFMRLKTKLFKDENTMFLEAVNDAVNKILEKLKEIQKGA